jgi:hypothetical protein
VEDACTQKECTDDDAKGAKDVEPEGLGEERVKHAGKTIRMEAGVLCGGKRRGFERGDRGVSREEKTGKDGA